MIDLFKGQITLDDIFYKLTYKEALILRDCRIKRLEARQKAMAEHGPTMDDLEEELGSQ